MEKSALVATAATDLVNRFSNEIEYIFKPRHMTLDEGRSEQTNPFTTLGDAERTEVVVQALTMILGQIAAMAFVENPSADQQAVYVRLSKMVRKHGDAYHQQFLQMKEAAGEKNNG